MSDSDNSSDGESANRNKSKSKIPDGFEIESLQEYEDLKKKSHDKVQALLMTAPWCNTCNHFKRKRMAKKSEELDKMADIKFICAEKYQSIVGKQGMVPKWKFFCTWRRKTRRTRRG